MTVLRWKQLLPVLCAFALALVAFACGGERDNAAVADPGASALDQASFEVTEDAHAGVVVCGKSKDIICKIPEQICCQGLSSAKCSKPDGCSGGFNAPAFCDGPEDCPTDKPVCCARFSFSGGSGSRCEASCPGTKTASILCHHAEDCKASLGCKSCQPPGGPAMEMCVETCPF